MTNELDLVSTHLIFGKNLRQLCRRVGTIAEVADSLEINRVQMNRILNGESFPKPGMLKRICEYFNTDARILLQPLDELEEGSFRSHDADISSVWNYTMFGRDYFVPENMLQDILPDGLHLMYRPSFLIGTQIWIGMVRVFGQNGVRMLRGLDPVAPGMRRSDLTPISVREYRGMMLQTNEALSFVYATRVPSSVMGVDNFSTRTWTTRGFFQGRCMIMSSANPIGKNVVPCILQPLEQSTSDILGAARKTGFCPIAEIPPKYQTYLASDGL